MKTAMSKLRWMNRADLPEVLKIEHQGFEYPWPEEEFMRQLARKDVIGLVCDCQLDNGEMVVGGYLVYAMKPIEFDLINIAVHYDFRRQGVATKMLNKLKGKLSQNRRIRMTAMVSENNLRACKFFKSQGFVAIETCRKYYDLTDWDAYKFQYSIEQPAKREMRNRMGAITE